MRRTYATDEYEFYVQDSWRIRPNLTVTGGVRYSLYSPPWEVDGLQLAPTDSARRMVRATRVANMQSGVADNALPPLTLDLAGPANGKKGFYDWDYNNFGPRVAAAWTPHARGGFLGWLTGGDKMVIRGGYSLLYDRVGFALATIFDRRRLVRHVDRAVGDVRHLGRNGAVGARFVNLDHVAADAARGRLPADSRRRRRSGRRDLSQHR